MAALQEEDGSLQDDTMDIDEPESTTGLSERVDEVFSDEWFADLDESIDAIANAFEELRVSQPRLEVNDDVTDAGRCLSDIQDELMDCLAALQNTKRKLRKSEDFRNGRLFDADRDGNKWKGGHDVYVKRPRSEPFYATTPDRYKHNEGPAAPSTSTASMFGFSPGEKVMKQLFRWWRPCRPGCVRDAKRLEEGRMTEVDGRLIE